MKAALAVLWVLAVGCGPSPAPDDEHGPSDSSSGSSDTSGESSSSDSEESSDSTGEPVGKFLCGPGVCALDHACYFRNDPVCDLELPEHYECQPLTCDGCECVDLQGDDACRFFNGEVRIFSRPTC